jgi:hypothetical protein
LEIDGLLLALMAVLCGTFFLAAFLTGRRLPGGILDALREGLAHYLALWLPIVASLFVLYLFVAVDSFSNIDLFPANPEELAAFSPRWLSVILYLLALAELLNLGRGLEAVLFDYLGHPNFLQVKSLALVMVGFGCLYFLLTSPGAIVLYLPVATWIFITGRQGWGRVLDIALFLFGGAMFLAFVLFMASVSAESGPEVLWYMLMATAVRTVSMPIAIATTIILAAGLSLVVKLPPADRERVSG